MASTRSSRYGVDQMTENDGHSRLRQLALDYARGRISRDHYLQERNEFLDALSALPPNAHPAALERPAESRPSGDEATIRVRTVAPKAAERARAASAGPASRKRALLAAVIGIAVVLIALLMALFPREGLQQPGHKADNGAEPQARPAGGVDAAANARRPTIP
jgi:hypothetical protein